MPNDIKKNLYYNVCSVYSFGGLCVFVEILRTHLTNTKSLHFFFFHMDTFLVNRFWGLLKGYCVFMSSFQHSFNN